MPFKIFMGVVDLPYNKISSYAAVGRRRPRHLRNTTMTTGEVADILEAKYGIMQFFFDKYEDQITESLAEAYADKALDPDGGVDVTARFGQGAPLIQEMFRDMLNNREMDGQVTGVPTAVAEKGYALSKNRAKRGSGRYSRASFVDTGLYRDSFRITVEE